jgi:quercetin dioxygenase-like cupin family protein
VSSFVKQPDVRQEQFDWGVIGWRLTPGNGSKHLVIMDVALEPGEGHDFHRHPGQEEMIIVTQGEITQYIEQESTSLGAGDSVYLDEGVVHASFNEGGETAHLQVVIGPSLPNEATGYGLEDVSSEEPWASVRS